MRWYLSLLLGAAFLGGGGWCVYLMFFEASKVSLKLLAGAGFFTFVGGYLLWDTLKDRRSK